MRHNHLLTAVLTVLVLSAPLALHAQSSDSVIVRQLRAEGVRFTNDNSVTLLMNGQEKFDDLFAAIRQARESIHLEYFNFRNDSIAGLLFDLLGEKAREGVEVRAMFDGFGNDSNNQPLKKHHLQSIRERGIQIVEYDPVRFPWVNHVWTRDHRKIVVIDGEIAYIGGMNVADYYINGTEQVGEWRDMHCRIEGSAVNDLQDIFARIWQKSTGEALNAAKYYKGDQDTIKLVNPYFTLIRKLKKALRNAIKRGVKLEIMISAKSDIPLTPDCVMYNAHKLMKHGAEVWVYQPGFHHTKIIMVDGKFCTVGSANLNARSLNFDYEENAVIIDPCVTAQLSRMFDNDKKKSVLMTPESWDKMRTGWQKFRGWFAHLLAPWM